MPIREAKKKLDLLKNLPMIPGKATSDYRCDQKVPVDSRCYHNGGPEGG